jgi:trehalose/maltose hydrolase-like predicted phosphorylase
LIQVPVHRGSFDVQLSGFSKIQGRREVLRYRRNLSMACGVVLRRVKWSDLALSGGKISHSILVLRDR